MKAEKMNSKAGATAHLIQVTPFFPPDIDGLGEFALHLGDALLEQFGIRSDVIVWKRKRGTGPAEIATPHQVQRLSSLGKAALGAALQARLNQYPGSTLLLHYTSYSYSKEGLPWWLPRVLKNFKASGGRIICFFHELYAKGHFPNKTWMGSWLQKKIFQQILTLCDVAITSNEGYFAEIQKHNHQHKPVLLAGIGSNIGALKTIKPIASRSRKMAVFGLYATRARLYERHMDKIKKLAELLLIDEIADVGSIDVGGIDDPAPILQQAKSELGDRLKIYGALPANQISDLLSNSMVGILNYNYPLHSKSGIVAAYQAHGVPSIVFSSTEEIATGPLADDCLHSEQIFTTPAAEVAQLLQKTSVAGFNEYRQNRSFDSVARKIEPLLY